ncbi:RBBP9/YdeN family alpha/beta hydrolase [Variovorax sp. W6]|uniref:RBBP9/YdeN family alpha/beta hydrolase n=1 Tax=Variovorax sp. W6 TaxID=3093895 RepID=UPI003D800FE7
MNKQAHLPTVLIVPGLRDHVAGHWQTLLATRLPRVRSVPPMGRENLDCMARVEAIEREAQAIEGPLVIVAHSGGVVMLAHWARYTCRAVRGALLATPPDFETPMPEGYPSLQALRDGGWLPVPMQPLPFPGIVAASRNDPLARSERVEAMARQWRCRLVDLGDAGHLNPASGYGEWPRAEALITELAEASQADRQAQQEKSHDQGHPLP